MGLIGWADALDREVHEEQESKVVSPGGMDVKNQDESSEPLDIGSCSIAGAVPESDVVCLEDVRDAYAVDEESDAGVVAFGGSSPLPQRDLQDELLEVIANLRLRPDEDLSFYDISTIEHHEVCFVFDHASRNQSLDFYRITRAIHEVKRRLLDMKPQPELLSSPNLDDLIGYIEDHYEASMRKDEQHG